MNTLPTAKTILCFGDSNTWGQKPDKTNRYAADVRWTGVLQDHLGDGFAVIEEGLSSRTTDLDYSRKPGRNGRTYLDPCLETHAPLDAVILMLGTNDFKIEFERSVDQIAAAIDGLVTLIQEKTSKKGPAAKIVLVSPIYINDQAETFREWYLEPGFYNYASVEKSRQLAGALQRVAQQKGCMFVDAASVAHPGSDGIHFSEESHPALGELLAEVINGLKW